MKHSVHMYEMNSFDYREAVASGERMMFIPVGAIEQHGPHMTMNVDVLLPTGVSERVAQQVGGFVAPPIMYGYKSQQRSGGGFHLPGTTSLDGQTLILTVKDIIKELARHGNRNFVLMNGHFENNMFLIEGIDLALRELRWEGITDAKAIMLSYWDFVDEATIEQLYPEGFTGWDLEHGGVMETSLMMLLHPEFVDLDRVMDIPPAELPAYDIFPIKPEYTPPSGCLSSAKASSAEKGQILMDVCVAGIVEAVNSEFSA